MKEGNVLFNDTLSTYIYIFTGIRKEGRKEMFYLTTHSAHFIYGYTYYGICYTTCGWLEREIIILIILFVMYQCFVVVVVVFVISFVGVNPFTTRLVIYVLPEAIPAPTLGMLLVTPRVGARPPHPLLSHTNF